MYRRIVLAYDGSLDGQEALRQAMDLACLCGAEVRLLAVIDPGLDLLAMETASLGIQQEEKSAAAILRGGLAQLRRKGLKAETELAFGSAANEICRVAVEFGADLIVVGHREQTSWMRWWNGSVGASVLVQAPCSLLVAVSADSDHSGSRPRCKVASFEKHVAIKRSIESKASRRSGKNGAARDQADVRTDHS